jgi:hypothetical protein
LKHGLGPIQLPADCLLEQRSATGNVAHLPADTGKLVQKRYARAASPLSVSPFILNALEPKSRFEAMLFRDSLPQLACCLLVANSTLLHSYPEPRQRFLRIARRVY